MSNFFLGGGQIIIKNKVIYFINELKYINYKYDKQQMRNFYYQIDILNLS